MLSSDSPRFREDFDITKSWFSQGSVWVASRKSKKKGIWEYQDEDEEDEEDEVAEVEVEVEVEEEER
ncbi:hypothetical protein M0802_006388 [Mischocyttarus mexicanus]|nr:hypothetical protein M0802_006388 [Mischocyttarus mexicanus]